MLASDEIAINLQLLGLSQRANHPAAKLHLLHGSLFDVRCTSFYCNYAESNNYTDPISPSLAIPKGGANPAPLGTSTSGAAATESIINAMKHPRGELDISDERIEIPNLEPKDLPQCPNCGDGLLRPGVVWFGEALPKQTMQEIDDFIEQSRKIDLILVIGTSSKVYPAAGYVDIARSKGAKVAVINMDKEDMPAYGMQKGDWFFEGDAGIILLDILKGEIGDLANYMREV